MEKLYDIDLLKLNTDEVLVSFQSRVFNASYQISDAILLHDINHVVNKNSNPCKILTDRLISGLCVHVPRTIQFFFLGGREQ